MLEQQGGTCYYCGCRLSRHNCTFDHVVPLSDVRMQRRHSLSNCVVACEKCNKSKGSKLAYIPPEKTWLERRLIEMEDRLEQRTRLAEWRLSMNPMGSFKKWQKYWEKKGRWATQV